LKAFDRGFWFRDHGTGVELPNIDSCPWSYPTGYEFDFFEEKLL